MERITRLCVDATFLGILVCSLLIVYQVDRNVRKPNDGETDTSVTSKKLPPAAPRPLELAVTGGGFDDMVSLLNGLGEGYHCSVVEESTLLDPLALKKFDAVFLTCSERKQGGDDARLAKALKGYVQEGGTLYASDLQFDTLASAFPEAVDRVSVAQGLKQDLRATVTSPELRDLLGEEVPLHFDQEGWRPAAFGGKGVAIDLEGTLKTTAGVEIKAPLLARFSSGEGNVIFTSFHNVSQISKVETRLLNHLIVSTVTAKVEANVTKAMVTGGFSPKRMNLLSASGDKASLSQIYDHKGPGHLTFSLGFESRGARLKLEVISPSGERKVRSGESTITINVDDPSEGRWSYQATPEILPYANFPFTMAVGVTKPKQPDKDTIADGDPSKTPAAGSVRFIEVETGLKIGKADSKRIAVTKPRFDDVGQILGSLGDGYPFETITDDELLDPEALDRFDILFLTCNGWPRDWGSDEGRADRPGLSYGVPRPEKVKQFGETLRRFVGRGGTLYASDLRREVLLWGFPHRKRLGGLNPAQLPEIDEAERKWLRVVSSTRKIQTVEELLRGLELSPALSKEFDRLHATIELSPLTRGGLADNRFAADEMLRKLFEVAGLSGTKEDISTLVDALKGWERSIRSALGGRSDLRVRQSQAQLKALQANLDSLRDSLNQDVTGVANQEVQAQVVEPGLKELVGDSLPLSFGDEASSWEPANFKGDDLVEYLRGNYRTESGGRANAPLLVRFPEGKGQVIFTSFHNEAQNSEKEIELLKYLVFSAVTAQEQVAAEKAMLSGGFPTSKRNLDSHSAGAPSVTRSYRAEKGGTVRFALTFPGGGARLKLTLVAPTGQTFEKETDAPLIIDAEGAPPGDWHYTITASKVPFENFPYSLSIGEQSEKTDESP